MERFSADTRIRDVLTTHPQAAAVFERHGLGCPSCLAADMDTLGAVVTMHDDITLEVLLHDLNAVIAEEDAS
jgi:hybrid cluster-associated redox disulfide protein